MCVCVCVCESTRWTLCSLFGVCLFVCLFSIGVTQSVSRTGLRSDCRGRVKGRGRGGAKGERERECVCVCVCVGVCVRGCVLRSETGYAATACAATAYAATACAATPGSAFWWFTRSILRSSCVSLREPTTRVSLVGSALRSGRFPHQAAGVEGAPGVSRRRPDCGCVCVCVFVCLFVCSV